MTVDDMYRIRQLIDCTVCNDNNWDLCHKLLTQEQHNEYAAKYGCICGCDCKCCKCKEDCHDN